MTKEHPHGTEPYLPGTTMTFNHLDDNEASRLVRRATELPMQIVCLEYAEDGSFANAAAYRPHEDIKNPQTTSRLLDAIDSMTAADDIIITEAFSQD